MIGEDLVLRDSMKKFECNETMLEIVKFSQPSMIKI